jgi:superfamily II DNA or RNA helicase
MQIGPKIIASTATTKSATNQIHKLFDRSETRIFPPQGFSFGDSFFSKEDPDENAGKLYVGICSTGKSGLTILAKISAAILRKTRSLQEKNTYNPDDLDPYYTLVSYFNSTREMGGAFKMFQDSVPGFMQRIYNNFEVEDTAQTKIIQKKSDEITNDDLMQSFETKDTQIASKRKFVNNLLPPEELTSRVESSEIPDILNKLEIGLSKGTPVDTLLSTNMLSVGVDLPRLGVMIINGQPKNHSEYIQASGLI